MSTSDRSVETSKFLSYVLRHRPDSIGITLDPEGWVEVDTLLEACATNGRAISRAQLEEVVATNNKKRFAFNEDGTRIRASQGHSVDVDLAYEPATPPEILYHGTVDRFLDSIREQGLIRGSRHHVHLSHEIGTAQNVGSRRGRPVVLRVRAGDMHRKGIPFFCSANGVWLTEHVPPEHIDFSTSHL